MAIRVFQAGLEGWVSQEAAIQVSQVGLEVWLSLVPEPIDLPARNKIGPTGLLGVPIRRFRERTLAGVDLGAVKRNRSVSVQIV